jgi:putative methionine-R-sulfoxide reductase with GAF domain
MPQAADRGLSAALAALGPAAGVVASIPDRDARLEAFVQLWWDAAAPLGASWAGFYVDLPQEPDDRRLVLAARRPKPACSPIGVHGACGQALLAARTLVVHDVEDLGAGYVACDPRDRSELVVPCLRADGFAWGVFDADSHRVGAFGAADGLACERLLVLAGLSEPHAAPPRLSR